MNALELHDKLRLDLADQIVSDINKYKSFELCGNSGWLTEQNLPNDNAFLNTVNYVKVLRDKEIYDLSNIFEKLLDVFPHQHNLIKFSVSYEIPKGYNDEKVSVSEILSLDELQQLTLHIAPKTFAVKYGKVFSRNWWIAPDDFNTDIVHAIIKGIDSGEIELPRQSNNDKYDYKKYANGLKSHLNFIGTTVVPDDFWESIFNTLKVEYFVGELDGKHYDARKQILES